MIFKFFVILFIIIEVVNSGKPEKATVKKRQTFPFGLFDQNLATKFTNFDEGAGEAAKGNKRNRRCFTSALSLLWPQVFGPVDQGYIEDISYNDVPKTLLEYRLDMIRGKAQEEEQTRLVIRDYLKDLTEAQDKFYGYPSNGEPGFVQIKRAL